MARTRARNPEITPSWGELWRRPMPGFARRRQHWIMQGVVGWLGRDIVDATGLENLRRNRDPFVMVLNHSTRLEAMLLPCWFAYLRGGHLIRFIADWNFALIPGIATILRQGECILLARKPAKPAFLNVFKPWFQRRGPAFERAEALIRAGHSVGLFPEGTTNRHPSELLRGFDGAARLSLRTGAPILPVGIRFPGHPPDRPIRDRTPMSIHVGEPMSPPSVMEDPPRESVREWHGRMMNEIARLSGKRWDSGSTRRKHHGFD